MSEFAPKTGERYDPQEAQRAKVYVVDAVDARVGLGDGAKRVHDRFYKMALGIKRNDHAWRGYVYPKIKSLAKMLGKSEAEIKRDVAELVEAGLNDVERPNRQEGNHYFFKWCSWFSEGSTLIPQDAPLRDQPRAVRKNPEGSKQGGLRDQNRGSEGSTLIPLYKEDSSCHSLQDSSSSSAEHSDVVKAEPEQQQLTTKKASFSSNGKPKTTDRWWDANDERKVAELLIQDRGDWNLLGNPDLGVVMAILPNMQSIPDVELWLAAGQGLFKKANSWGRYVTDSREWPARRAHAHQHLQHAIETDKATPQCPHGLANPGLCDSCEEAELQRRRLSSSTPGYETIEERTLRIDREEAAARAAKKPDPEPACGICKGWGIVGELADTRWCGCPAGELRRVKEPAAVDQQHRAARITAGMRRMPA
jgi:hypothetical protein